MVIAILIILLLIIVYFYFASTVEHLVRTLGMTFRMLLIILFVFFVLGLVIYSLIVFDV
jgi:hypothetical protein